MSFTNINSNLAGKGGPTAAAEGPTVRIDQPRSWEQDYLSRDVMRFFYRWGGSLSAVLVRLRRRYQGDLDLFLLHLVFMLTELAEANAAAEALAKGAPRVIRRRRGLNMLSLADISRVPKETVRRKLALMVELDLIRREDDGLYYLGPASDLDQFFYDLAPLFWDGVRPEQP